MIAIQQSLNCGAAVCELNAGVCVIDAGMEFVRCPTCCVLHIPPENLLHSNVLPDRTEKLSIVMKILLSMRMRWLLKELPQLADKDIWIADVGCGDGQFLEFLGTRGYSKIVGIEPDVERAFNADSIPLIPTMDGTSGITPAITSVGLFATCLDSMQPSCTTETMSTKYFLGLTQSLRH